MTLVADQEQDARTPLVSAIIIFLNGEKYLGEAIDSILAQTMTDWELILVDDGSGAAATKIAKDYARAHPGRIRYAEHPGHENRGMSASRNAGLRLARGKYVGFLDADDIWLPEHLAIYTRILEETPEIGLVFGRTLLWWSWTPGGKKDGVMEPELPLWRILEPPMVVQRMLDTSGRSVPAICAIVARLDAVRASGGFEDSFRTLYEDQVFFNRMFLNHRAMAIDAVLDLYRQHPESACYSEGAEIGDARARPRFLAWLKAYFDERGVTDPALRAALERRLWRAEHPRMERLRRFPERLAYRVFNALPRPVRWRLSKPFYAMMALGQKKPQPMDAAARALRKRFMDGFENEHASGALLGAAAARRFNRIG